MNTFKNIISLLVLSFFIIIAIGSSDDSSSSSISYLNNSSISNNHVIADCTVKFIVNADQVARDIAGVNYKLLKNKYPEASTIDLKINLSYTNSYGEKKVKYLGTCSQDSKDVSNIRRYTSASNYKYSDNGTMDCFSVLYKHARLLGLY